MRNTLVSCRVVALYELAVKRKALFELDKTTVTFLVPSPKGPNF
jgi:hypothetical protein